MHNNKVTRESIVFIYMAATSVCQSKIQIGRPVKRKVFHF